jgi:PAS domain S-box-containing protein
VKRRPSQQRRRRGARTDPRQAERDALERRAEDERNEFIARMNEAEKIAQFGVWRWEIATGEVRWSDQLHRIYGLHPGDFGGTVDDFVALLHPDDRAQIWANIDVAVRTAQPFIFHERILHADGGERVLLSQGRPVTDADGTPVALVGLCQDVTERIAAERALGHSERRMRAILDNAPSAIVVKDLEGNYVMANAEIGRLLGAPADELRGKDADGLFPELADRLRANDVRAAAEMHPVLDEFTIDRDGGPRSYLSVTFALPDEHGRPVETCTIATDVSDRGQHAAEQRDRVFWSSRISAAVREDRLVVFSQPVIDLATGRADASELLVRMKAPDDSGLLMPASFLPAAERFGLIQMIDVWMVEQALQLPESISPEVNLSAVSLCDDGVRREIVSLLKQRPEAGRRIVFEITESAAAEHLDAAIEFAIELAALGCGFALDDFGTGFATFTYLRRLPLRYLKIDASFVRDLVGDHDDRRVVQSIIGIASQFGLRTIAEGVEDAATLRLLRELGADYAQGFHIGVPAPVEEAAHAAGQPLAVDGLDITGDGELKPPIPLVTSRRRAR